MKKIIKSELYDVEKLLNFLETELEDINNLSSALNSFFEDTILVGKDYDEAKKKVSLYMDTLGDRKIIAKSLKESILESTKQLKNFMEDYEILDSTQLGEVERSYRIAKTNYYNLLNMINNTTKGDTFHQYDITRQDLDKYYSLLISIENKISKLKELDGLDESLYSSYISECQQTINNYISEINNIKSAFINLS